jgi:hypothetical protein
MNEDHGIAVPCLLGNEVSMKPFLQRSYWLIVVPLYFLLAFFLLTMVSPISVDGGGPSPTFYWGAHAPHPTLAEYRRDRSIRMRFLSPYFLAAFVLTGLGCGLSVPVHRFLKSKISFPWIGSFLTILALILGASLVSDLGTILRLWNGPMLVSSFASVALTLKVAVPMSAVAALLGAVRPHPSDNPA